MAGTTGGCRAGPAKKIKFKYLSKSFSFGKTEIKNFCLPKLSRSSRSRVLGAANQFLMDTENIGKLARTRMHNP